MDSVTQAALGAAVGQSIFGQKLGRSALVIGAVLGTVPDLDVLVRYDDAVASFTYHRSWSHSLFVLSLASLPVAILISRLRPCPSITFSRWWLGCWLVLITHPLLDGFTIYGTQLFWPLPMAPVSIGSIFIIDPVFTLPLIIGIVCAWRWRNRAGQQAVLTALVISSVYLSWTVVAQNLTHQRVERQLAKSGIEASGVVIAPFPTTLLWRTVVMDSPQYYEGFTSLLDKSKEVRLTSYDSGRQQFAEYLSHWPVKQLDWFTKGAIALYQQNNELIVADLRMGIEDSYVFRFAVAELGSEQGKSTLSRQMPMQFDVERGRLLLERITDENVVLGLSP